MVRRLCAKLAIVVACALAVSSVGCAGSRREAFMYERAGDHIYDRPMPEVWSAAKQLLSDEGYSGREVRGGWVFVTEWKETGGGSSISETNSRYLLEGKELSPSRCTVHFTRVTRSAGASGSALGRSSNTHTGMSGVGTPPPNSPLNEAEGIGQKSTLSSGSRDLGMELKLLWKLDPSAAGAIEAQAKREYPDD